MQLAAGLPVYDMRFDTTTTGREDHSFSCTEVSDIDYVATTEEEVLMSPRTFKRQLTNTATQKASVIHRFQSRPSHDEE